MKQSAYTFAAVLLFSQCQKEFRHFVNGQQDGLFSAFDLPKDALQRPSQSAVIRVFGGAHFHIHACRADFHPAERLTGLSEHKRNAIQCFGEQTALSEPVNEPLRERQFIVATFYVHKNGGASGGTLQFAKAQNERSFPYPSRSGKKKVCSIGQFTL